MQFEHSLIPQHRINQNSQGGPGAPPCPSRGSTRLKLLGQKWILKLVCVGLEGCSPWGHWGLDTTERLHFDFSLSCVGEGNGNPLQCSCLENPRDGGAWWAAVYGVAQSPTWLKWLSSSSSSSSRPLKSSAISFWTIIIFPGKKDPFFFSF